jgi:hypothetical protein
MCVDKARNDDFYCALELSQGPKLPTFQAVAPINFSQLSGSLKMSAKFSDI